MASGTAAGRLTLLMHRVRESNRVRSAALVGACCAFIGVPTLGPLLTGSSEDAGDLDTEITPPDYAFAIWAPIFVANAANAAHGLTHPADQAHRRSDWWMAGAYTANAMWSLLAQFRGFRRTELVLPIAAACAAAAHVQVQPQGCSGTARITPAAIAGLLGWTSVASVVNVFATSRTRLLSQEQASGRHLARAAVVASAVPLSVAVSTSRRGWAELAVTSGWAFGASALNRRRSGATRAANAVAATAVGIAVLARCPQRWTPHASARRTNSL